jgi:hypothetical protein
VAGYSSTLFLPKMAADVSNVKFPPTSDLLQVGADQVKHIFRTDLTIDTRHNISSVPTQSPIPDAPQRRPLLSLAERCNLPVNETLSSHFYYCGNANRAVLLQFSNKVPIQRIKGRRTSPAFVSTKPCFRCQRNARVGYLLISSGSSLNALSKVICD